MANIVYPLGCRWDSVCKRTGKYSEAKGSHCLHNGGVDCKVWCKLTNNSLGGSEEDF